MADMTNAPAAEVQPNLDGLNQPGPAAAPSADSQAPQSTMESVAPPNLTQGNLPAYGEPGAPAQPSTVVPAGAPTAAPQPHARLLSMIQGLAIGLGAASKSIATHGREGGAEEVVQIRGEEQRQQQEATAAAQVQKNAQLQNQISALTINHLQGENIKLNATLQDEVNLSHMKVKEAAVGLAGTQQ